MKKFWVCFFVLVATGCLEAAVDTTNNASNNETNNASNNETNNATCTIGSCIDVSASACREGTCKACNNNGECAHLADTPACVNKTCKACSPATEDANCGGKVCNPQTFECTEHKINSQDICGECTSSTQCSGDAYCIQMGDTSLCLASVGVTDLCKIPFKRIALTTVEMELVFVCGYEGEETGCTDRDKFVEACNDSSMCGKLVCTSEYCTYVCDAGSRLCPNNMVCTDALCLRPQL